MRICRNRWLGGGLALLGLVLAGCSGPASPLDVGTQTVPLSLVLGQLKATDNAPVGPVMGSPVPWTRPYYQPPSSLPGLPTLPPVHPKPCPDFNPLAPVLAVGSSIDAPPANATYTYRVPLYRDIEPGRSETFIGESTWTVQAKPADPKTGAYDVVYTVKYGANVTTRVLRTFPHDVGSTGEPSDQTNPNEVLKTVNTYLSTQGSPVLLPRFMPNLAAYGLAGIYLVSQRSNDGSSFTPTVPIALVQLRQLTGLADTTEQNAAAITSVGFDPATQAVMAFRSTVTGPAAHVNACGTKLESVQVTLSSPNAPDTSPPRAPLTPDYGAAVYITKAPSSDATHPKANVTLFGEKIDFGLQFGGLVLQDQSAVAQGVPPNGEQIDPLSPPTATPSGPPPTLDASDPANSAKAAAVWASSPALAWAFAHEIVRQSTFIINTKPKRPKAS